MTVKRKDFQKTAAYVQEFLLKLSEDVECAELRDALNLALLHMQKYYRLLQGRLQEKNGNHTFRSSVRGLSPMTPFKDAPDKFQWRWINLENPRVSMSISMTFDGNQSSNSPSLPDSIQASKHGDISWLQELVEIDVHVINDIDAIGRTPLMYSIHHQQLNVTKYLIDMGADINATAHDGSSALHIACHEGNTDAIKLLLDTDCDHTLQDSFGRAPIHWAVVTPSTGPLQLLTAHGANVNIRDKDGLSPCMWACRLDHIEHFEKLSVVENQNIDEADGIERDNNGRTWMHWAVRRTEPLECLRTLLTQETAVIKDDDGKTVMLLAAEIGSLPACKVIVEIAGNDCVNDRDDHDRTPLHLSAMGGHGEVCNFLLEKGGELESRDKYNATSWEYARGRQLHYCMLILASHQRQRARDGSRTPESEKGGFGFRESSNLSDAILKPITPPRPPKDPPPNRGKSPRGLAMKRPLRSSSLTRSESFDVQEQGEKDAKHLRSKSLDSSENVRLLQHSMSVPLMRTDYAMAENLYDGMNGENSDETTNESQKTARKPGINGESAEIYMSIDETEDDEIVVTGRPNSQETQEDVEFGMEHDVNDNVSLGEMDVSDLDGDESDQATVIHRPHKPKSQPTPPAAPAPAAVPVAVPLQPARFQPRPPNIPNKPVQIKQPVAPPKQPVPPKQPHNYIKPKPESDNYPRYVAGPGENEVAGKEDEFQHSSPPRPQPQYPKNRHPGPVPVPRGTRVPSSVTPPKSPIHKPAVTPSSPGISPRQLGSPARQSSPGRLTQRSTAQIESQRSSSQASRSSTELDQTVHEIQDDVLGPPLDYRHQAPLTPPERKLRPPLPPQLMPLNQPRMPGSHLQLPPATKADRKKKKKKKRAAAMAAAVAGEADSKGTGSTGYIAPLQPPSDLQPSIRSANLYNRSRTDRLFHDGVEGDELGRPSFSNLPPAHSLIAHPQHSNHKLNYVDNDDTLASVETESIDSNGPFSPDDTTPPKTNTVTARASLQSAHRKQNGSLMNKSFPASSQRIQSGLAPHTRVKTARALQQQQQQQQQQPAAFQGELPPQIEGHKVSYARGPGRPPAHLAPPSYSQY
ncbi:uncharacterized protein LOC141898692 isoform X2 [Tubulanus polymorphus]|uniref:uncharacterized protein LOC141898692 isoform X2 n=1 Tax=Tubulanus polymorphus TaxID=672921 RepID=UPI003DA362E7